LIGYFRVAALFKRYSMLMICIIAVQTILLPISVSAQAVLMSANDLLSAGKNNDLAKVMSVDGKQALEVTYPAGSYNPSGGNPGGYQFHASPPSVFPTEEATLSYQLKFSDNFQWVKGKFENTDIFLHNENIDRWKASWLADWQGNCHRWPSFD
jgi:hypothetical protein